ncbi:MAG: CoA transferase, partial [Polymorphobacter sp.]
MAMAGVLRGLKVLDLSWGIAGPMTGMLLADHGAAVTRIERPEGDPFPGLLGYKVWHRGKRNAVLDLKDAGDHALFLRLVAYADVLVESCSPGVAAKLGIDFASLTRINPRLIMCSITGYGADGPDAGRPGYDALVAARSGLQFEQRGWPEGAVWHMTGRENPFVEAAEIEPDWVQGANREGPLFVASPWPSLGAFFSASTGIAAALFARSRSGHGQHVQTSLLQGAMACGSGVWQRMDDPDAPGFNTWILASNSPKGHFQCKDGRWVHNWVPNPRFILQA